MHHWTYNVFLYIFLVWESHNFTDVDKVKLKYFFSVPLILILERIFLHSAETLFFLVKFWVLLLIYYNLDVLIVPVSWIRTLIKQRIICMENHIMNGTKTLSLPTRSATEQSKSITKQCMSMSKHLMIRWLG